MGRLLRGDSGQRIFVSVGFPLQLFLSALYFLPRLALSPALYCGKAAEKQAAFALAACSGVFG